MNLLDVCVQAGFCQIQSHITCEYLALKMIVYHLSIGYNSSTHIQAIIDDKSLLNSPILPNLAYPKHLV